MLATSVNDAGQILVQAQIDGTPNSPGVPVTYLLTPTLPGDANGDGTVNISDLSNVLTNYDKTAGAFGGIEAVPEPGSITLLLAGAVGLLVWRRSR
jgi:hypothetical protein